MRMSIVKIFIFPPSLVLVLLIFFTDAD